MQVQRCHPKKSDGAKTTWRALTSLGEHVWATPIGRLLFKVRCLFHLSGGKSESCCYRLGYCWLCTLYLYWSLMGNICISSYALKLENGHWDRYRSSTGLELLFVCILTCLILTQFASCLPREANSKTRRDRFITIHRDFAKWNSSEINESKHTVRAQWFPNDWHLSPTTIFNLMQNTTWTS